MSEKPPAFQWYPKDCDTDENVRLMDDAEFGFYVRCLNHAWLNEGLPEDLADLARLMNRPIARVKQYWARVGKCFTLVDSRWRNMKQEGQRKTAREFQESRRNAANAMHDKRRKDAHAVHVHELCTADAVHVQCSPSASPSASAERAVSPPPRTPETLKFPDQIERRVRLLADGCPNQQDFKSGVELMLERVKSAVDPERCLVQMEESLPLWYEAMRDGRARIKPLRFILADDDYLKRPREPTKKPEEKKPAYWIDPYAHLEKPVGNA